MRIWFDRAGEIDAALEAHGGRWLFHAHVLRRTLWSLPLDGQRMKLTQDEFGLREGIAPSEVSRAFKALFRVGALLLPRRVGKSQSWEVDARFASRLNDADRETAIERQAREVAEAHAAAARRAPVKLRDLGPIPDTGLVEDERQPSLV